MKLTNLENHTYYPNEKLVKDLKELIIFAENSKKGHIPNCSVFIYADTDSYNPSILKTDVGCGITAFITEEMDFDDESIDEIFSAVNDIGIHIGQGNHFLDFTIGHPTIRRETESNMVFLHSDFNNENILPGNYSQARDLEKRASEMRFQYLEKLTGLLGISSEFYKDWIHNSVSKEDGLLVYRKGAINLQQSEGVGVLALNQIDGLFLYRGEFEEYHYSAQHGLGRTGSKGELLKELTKKNQGMARGYIIPPTNTKIDNIKVQVYNPLEDFLNNHYLDFSPVGVCTPELVITTKKSSHM